tara:strand:- start:384 stop:941 length:558 start_codon:yes stop_codon:yes gene_type:complete
MRYKEFNSNKVLEDCISLFWKKGFNGSAINHIVSQTKVNRFSLYKEFDNKHGLLYATLKLYKERYCLEAVNQIALTKDVNEALKKFLFSYINRDGKPSGCYIIYIATELGDHNEYVNDLLKSYLLEIETTFVSLLNTDERYRDTSKLIASNLILLFCNAMCFCHIQDEIESQEFISLNLDIILNN